MTKYFEPKKVWYCLNCARPLHNYNELARSHPTHVLVAAVRFGRFFDDPDKDSYFADVLDQDMQGETESNRRLIAGEVPINESFDVPNGKMYVYAKDGKELEELVARKSLGETLTKEEEDKISVYKPRRVKI